MDDLLFFRFRADSRNLASLVGLPGRKVTLSSYGNKSFLETRLSLQAHVAKTVQGVSSGMAVMVLGAGRRAKGAWCRTQDAGCGVQGAECRVQGAECRVQGAGCRVQGAGCRVYGFRLVVKNMML